MTYPYELTEEEERVVEFFERGGQYWNGKWCAWDQEQNAYAQWAASAIRAGEHSASHIGYHMRRASAQGGKQC